MPNDKRKIVAVLTDLMFRVKIEEAAKRAGLEAIFVPSEKEALSQAKENPAVVILDLNHAAAEPLQILAKLKNDAETKNVNVLCYVSHVQADLKRAAQALGCDQVMARSAFSQNLPAILGRYATS